MASIEKLSIRGVRSFSPNREEIIEFYHPLTVILGDNGSGKTTIIECLKLACTGALPPGARSGQSFVQDPRIAGTTEVKASVRLRFRNRAGKPMVVQRTFQLQQNKTQLKYKAMDGVIRVVNDIGEKVSMSHKCAELDRHIPEMLGVSKSILESVIFCHQEDSNWPLQEGAELKKRFDGIFESARYTKALEAIRKLKVARGTDAKDFQRDLDVMNTKLKAAGVIRDNIETSSEKLQAVKEEAGELDDNVDKSVETLTDMEQLMDDISKLHVLMERLEDDAARSKTEIERAYEGIEQLMSDSDEELHELLKNYDANLTEHERSFRQLQGRESQLKADRKVVQNTYSDLCNSKGNVEARIQTQQKNLESLLDMAAKSGTKYHFHTQPLSAQGGDLKLFQGKFQNVVADKIKTLELLEAEDQKAEEALLEAFTDLKSKLQSVKDQLKMKERELGSLNAEKRDIASKIKDLSASSIPTQRDVNEADKLVHEAERSLQSFKDHVDIVALKNEVQSINKTISSEACEVDQLAEQVRILRSHEQEHLSLESKRRECQEKDVKLREEVKEKCIEFRHLLDGVVPEDDAALVDASKRLCEIAQSKDETCKTEKHNLSKAQEKLQENMASSKHLEKTLTTLRSEKNELERGPVGELKQMMSEVLPGEDLRNADVALKQAEEMYFQAKDKTLRYKNTITFLSVFKKKGEKEKCCPLCKRDMDPQEEAAFVNEINNKTDDKKVKDKIMKADALEEAARKRWKGIESNMHSWRKLVRLEEDIPTKSKELDSLYIEQRALQEEVKNKEYLYELAQKQFGVADKAKQVFEQLMTDFQDLHRANCGVAKEEERLRSAVKESLGANAPRLSEVQAAKDAKQANIYELNQLVQKKQSDIQRNQDIQQGLQNALHNKQQDKMQLDQKRKDFDAANEVQNKLREREQVLREEISTLTDSEPQLDRNVRAKSNEVQSHRATKSAEQQRMRREVQQSMGDLRAFNDAYNKIEAEQKQQLDKELQGLVKQIEETQQEEVGKRQALEDLVPQLASAQRHLAEQESLKREIRDNLEYRRKKHQLEVIRSEMIETRDKIGALPSLDDVTNRVHQAKATVNAARDERSTLRGRQQELENQIRDYKRQLKGTDYRNVEEQHRHKLIQFETTMMAVTDLDKYYKALDKSLLQYHSKKVDEINTIIRTLWQITYKGQDIDTIELVSGQELNTGGVKATRSYDYRVVMKKGGALVDMRGRCSAGQKVLAALVIRLALAETFCLNCGILALDEPTTNLDTENKYGLAQAITDILNARSSQQNFQLVCITHDEEFVQMLSQTQAMDGVRPEYYWRISREDIGNNRFASKIERKDWQDRV